MSCFSRGTLTGILSFDFFKERFSWIIWSFSFSFSTGYVFGECLSGVPFLTVKFSFFFFHDKKMLVSGFYYMRISSLHFCSFGPFMKRFNPTLTLLHLIYFKSISMTSTSEHLLKFVLFDRFSLWFLWFWQL